MAPRAVVASGSNLQERGGVDLFFKIIFEKIKNCLLEMPWLGIRFFPKNALLGGTAGRAFPPCLTLNHLLGHPQGEEMGKKNPFSGKLPQNPSVAPACRRSRAAAPGIPPGAFLGRAQSGSRAEET